MLTSLHYQVMIRNLFFICMGLSFTSCLEEVELGHPNRNSTIVIDGRITNEFKEHSVKVSTSSTFSAEEAPRALTGLQVILKEQNTIHLLRETSPGNYQTDSLAGVPGRAYTLQVRDGGQLYEAYDTIPPLPSPFAPIEFQPLRSALSLEYRRHQFGFLEPNLWELHIIRDSIPEDLLEVDPDQLGQQVGIQVGAGFSYVFTYYTHPRIEVSGLMNFDIPHFYGFTPGFSVQQKKFGLSESYYTFLRALFLETEWRGTLFSTAPANVQGNFSGGAQGYFSAMSVVSMEFSPE